MLKSTRVPQYGQSTDGSPVIASRGFEWFPRETAFWKAMSRMHAVFVQRTVRYHPSAGLRSSLVEIGFTVLAILFARRSAPERGHFCNGC